LDATVESKKSKRRGFAIFRLHSLIFGSVRVMNQNIDLVELERIGGNEVYLWQCNYVVQAKVNGLEDRLKAKLKVVRKGFWMPKVVDFKWEGRELAQVLNGDVDLRDKLYRMARARDIPYGSWGIKPDKKHQRVRIRPSYLWFYLGFSFNVPWPWDPKAAFPSIETFEAFDKIAHHIRSITNVRP